MTRPATRLATVTQGPWNVSVCTSSDAPGARLSVFRGFYKNRPRYGDANGLQFKTSDEAWAFALLHGYIQVYRKGWCVGCRKQHWFCGRRASVCALHGGYPYPGCAEAQEQFDRTRPALNVFTRRLR